MKTHPERVMKLRLVVGRFGEMDIARWWNTNGQLGNLGAAAVRRGLARTHYFAQARAVFAVAAQRCAEVFDPLGCVTLWRLPESIESELETHWEQWLDTATEWVPFFESLSHIEGTPLPSTLRSLGLASEQDIMVSSKLRRAAEGRAVPIPGPFTGSDEDLAQLALGFARGEVGTLAVPYARIAAT